MRYDANRRPPRQSDHPNTLYPEDLELLLTHLPSQPEEAVVQISTFSTQNNNMPLDTQRESMVAVLSAGGFVLQGETRVGMQMASFVFSRNLQLQCDDLQARFADWLEEAE